MDDDLALLDGVIGDDPFDLLDGYTVDDVGTTLDASFKLTSDKDYHRLKMFRNVTSYSMNLELHACPRKLQLMRYRAGTGASDDLENIDFAFGHAVGAGVQNLFITGNMQTALFNSFLAWRAPFDFRIAKSKKSIWEAGIAVEKFAPFIRENMEDWELVTLSNGRPGIELSFSLDCNNGYIHYGHIDVVVRHKYNGTIAVVELKTTGMKNAEEAVYANSSQAIGYSIILDSLFPGLTSYEVFHFIYSSSDREWTPMPFTKTVAHKTEWIKDLLLDHSTLDTYHRINFYPKRGESCFNYYRRCEFFGTCNIVPDEPLPELAAGSHAEMVDYQLNLADIVKAQQDKLLENSRA